MLVHPQSLVHSFVEWIDGSWISQLSVNDMVFPIQYALAWPERWANEFPRLELEKLGQLEFEPLDDRRFPAVALARQALAAGDSAPAVFNAANEVAVHAFLDGRASFPAIVDTVSAVLDRHSPVEVATIAEALHHDAWARREAENILAAAPPSR